MLSLKAMSRKSSCLRSLIPGLLGLLFFIPASGQQDDDADSSFGRVSHLSTSGFFEILTESRTGFSLYRKILSRLRPADYATVGYTSTGSRSPFYEDASQYYLFYPDGKKFTRFSHSHSGLRKKLAGINPVARKFMEEHPEELTQQLILRLCDVLNE